jgi:hypothetical protein
MSKDQNHPPRGIAAATYSGLAVVGLAAIALVSASVSGAPPADASAARLTSAAVRGDAAASDEQGTPPFGTRAQSRRLARRLLAKVVLPPGTGVFGGRKLPAELRQPAQEMEADHSVDVHQVFTEQQPMRATIAFVERHHPGGKSSAGTGEVYDIRHGKKIVREEDVSYSPEHLGARYSAIQVVVEVVPGDHGRVLTRADVQVIWYPVRSAAEHLTARDFRAVRIDALIYGTGVHEVKRTFRQQAIIGKLSRVLNSRPAHLRLVPPPPPPPPAE